MSQPERRYVATLCLSLAAKSEQAASLEVGAVVDAVSGMGSATNGENLCGAIRTDSGREVVGSDGAWSAALDFYLWAADDDGAVRIAAGVAAALPLPRGAKAELKGVSEQPFGKPGSRPVWPDKAPFSTEVGGWAGEWMAR